MHIVLTGCSGGGKSSLLDLLALDGHRVVPEPARRIVRRALAGGEGPLPWQDGPGFARACLDLAQADCDALAADPPEPGQAVFFDRTALDAALWLQRHGHPVPASALPLIRQRIDLVLLAPPWPELRRTDAERQGSWDEALAEYHSLAEGYLRHGHTPVLLPKVPLDERLAFVTGLLRAAGGGHRLAPPAAP